ncbi:hypothetical protein L950_0212510 [Sphingobacterium sp. IITKGP-BTPF85]|nr:hypothetical protein L950_0212510 [Sphingobacterium sp. IITKGP-BTPF85]
MGKIANKYTEKKDDLQLDSVVIHLVFYFG